MLKSSPMRFFKCVSNASLSGSNSSSPRYKRLSSTQSEGTPSKSGNAVLGYHCSEIYSSLDGSSNLAATRIIDVSDHRICSLPFGKCLSKKSSSLSCSMSFVAIHGPPKSRQFSTRTAFVFTRTHCGSTKSSSYSKSTRCTNSGAGLDG
jgi:hypothetical protein